MLRCVNCTLNEYMDMDTFTTSMTVWAMDMVTTDHQPRLFAIPNVTDRPLMATVHYPYYSLKGGKYNSYWTTGKRHLKQYILLIHMAS